MKLNFFTKTELLIAHPHKFFEKIQKEKDKWKEFEFLFIYIFLAVVINALFIMPSIIKEKSVLPLLPYIFIIILFIFLLIVSSLILSLAFFAIAFVYHLIIKLFTGKRNLKETYKLVYAFTPILLALLIPFYSAFEIIFFPAIALAALDTIYINYVGLRKLHKMTKENAIAVLVVMMLIIIGILFFLR